MKATTRQLAGTARGIITIVLECISFAAMLPFMYIEIRSIEEYREDWLNAWNILDVIAYITQVTDALQSSHKSCWHHPIVE